MARSMSNMRKVIDDMDPANQGSVKAAQAELRRQLDDMEAAHQQEMDRMRSQMETMRDQETGVGSGLRVQGPLGMEGEDLDEFMDEAAKRHRERMLDAPFSEGERQALVDPLYQQGGSIVDPLDPRPVRTPIEAAAANPALVLNRARRI